MAAVVAQKKVKLSLEATVVVREDHDAERYLEDLRRAFANRFSVAVHEYYPDAVIRTVVVREEG